MSYSRFVSTIAVIAVCASLFAGSASAADEKVEVKGLYGGAGFGIGTSDDPSDTDYAWRMNVWWRPFEYGSIEIGYIDAGHPDGPGKDEIDGLHLVAKPTLPLPGGFDLYGKVGGFFWDDSNVAVGLGADYRLPYDFGVRLDWDLLNADNDGNMINVVTLGLYYQFAKQP